MKRRTAIAGLLALALVGLLVCPSTLFAASSLKPAKEQVLRINIGAEPETLDPAKSTGIPEAKVELNMFEGLTRLDKNNLPQPAIAERWEVSRDGLTYTFYLRKAYWSNGDPVTAYDFEYAWKRALDPKTASQYAYQLYYIKNGEAYNSGKITDPEAVGVKALDERTLRVTLEAPTPYFLSLTAFPTLFPVNKKVVEANPDGWALKPETYVTNGPFKMVEWVHNNRIVAVKNERYWDAKNVKLSKVVFTLVEDHTTELTLWETDQIEITDQVPPQEIERLRREKKLKSSPYIAVYYYIFNVEKKPLNDPRVRKALAYAIDRQAIVEKVVKGGQKPALAFTPYGLPDAKPGQDFRQVGGDYFKDNDVETARKLLAEAGYPGGQGFPTLEILYNTLESHKAIAEAIQEMWKRNLGINVTLTNQEWKVYLQTRDEGNFQIARAGWVGDYLDPMTFMDVHVTGGGNNDSNYSNPKYDQLIETAKKSGDPKVRMKAMHDAEKILMEDMPVMPIYFYVNLFLEKDYVHDVIHSALGFVDLKNAWLSAR